MNENKPSSRSAFVARAAPGLMKLLNYKKSDLPHDLFAGLSVAAVALPVGWRMRNLQDSILPWDCTQAFCRSSHTQYSAHRDSCIRRSRCWPCSLA